MHKTRLRKLAVLLPCMAALAVILAVPAFAISEADVEATVASQGKESVSGNLFVWFLCAIAFLKVSTKIDSILQAMGLGVGRAPGSILAEAFMALRGMQAGKAVLAGKMPGMAGGGHGSAGGAGAASAFSGGLAGMVSSKLQTDTATAMGGGSGGVASGIGASLYKSTLGQDGGFASRVIGSVATGQTPGAIRGEAAEEAMEGYFAGTPDPVSRQDGMNAAVTDFPADAFGSIPPRQTARFRTMPVRNFPPMRPSPPARWPWKATPLCRSRRDMRRRSHRRRAEHPPVIPPVSAAGLLLPAAANLPPLSPPRPAYSRPPCSGY